ncbi:MAG: ATP-binding protein [Thermoplasmata archaeon]
MPGAQNAPPFIGRPEAAEALRRRLDEAIGGRGGLTIIEGESGVGKTTLALGLIDPSRQQGMHVLVGRALSLDNPPPLHLVRSIRPAGQPEMPTGGSIDRGTSDLAFALPEPSPSVLLGFAPRTESATGADRWARTEDLLDALGPAEGSTEASRSRMFADLTDGLLGLARESPTLVLLEDLHRADEASMEFLEFLVPQLAASALWLVVTSVPAASLSDSRRVAIEHLTRGGEAGVITVRPLLASEVGEFVRVVDAGRNVAVEDVTRWHSQTGGNPLFIEQLLRQRRSIGPTPAPEGLVENASPVELAQYLAQQLPTLDEEENRAMTVGAVLGRQFPFSLLQRASGEEEERLAESVERLVARGILRERGNELIEFTHEALRAEVYAGLTDTRRRLLHRRAAEALEATGGADVETIFALARHYYLGKVDERAALFNRLAAEFAARSYSPAMARQHLERAIEAHRRALPHDLAGELEMTLELASQLDRMGELRPAERLLREALDRPDLVRAGTPTQRAFLRIHAVRVLADQGRWDEADGLTEELLGSAEVRASPVTTIAAHRIRGELLYYRGRYVESLAQHDAALALAKELGDPREMALESVRRANVLGMIPGRVEEAIAAYRQAREELVARGDRGEAAYALLFLGVVLSQHGRTPEGLVVLAEAQALAEGAHDLRRVGWSLFNIADLKRELNDLTGAAVANNRSRAILERIGDRFGLTQALIVAGKILIDRKEWNAAEIELLEAFRLVRDLNTPADELDVSLRLAEVALGRGDRTKARERADDLARRRIVQVRPDLTHDFESLTRRLHDAEADRATETSS